MIPTPLEHLMKQMARLPGLGPRSAQRAALYLLTNPEKMHALQHGMHEVAQKVVTCTICGNIGLNTPCHVCTDEKRDVATLCIVEGVDDLWALERSRAYTGHYHVLGGVISALDGIRPEDLNLAALYKRMEQKADTAYTEVILALGASVDGQTTSHLISRHLKKMQPDIKISTLAKGMPMGANVDYMDEGTLSLALQGRMIF